MEASERVQRFEKAPRALRQTLLGFGLARHKAHIHQQVYERERSRGNFGPIKCLRCGEPAVDIHELNLRGYRRKAAQFKMYHLKNCFPLCRKCHDEMHGTGKGVQEAREEFRRKIRTLYGYEYAGRGLWPEFYIDEARLASEWLERYGVLEFAIERGWL